MSKCDNCGRDDGHWLGCSEAANPQVGDTDVCNTRPSSGDGCAFLDCTEPRRSADKRVKFCETHSDPKNRK